MTGPEDTPATLLGDAAGFVTRVAAFILVAGLLVYSALTALSAGSEPVQVRAPVAASASPRASLARSSTFLPAAASEPVVVSGYRKLLIVISCDGERASDAYPDSRYYLHVTLQPSTDRDAISALLSGTDTTFPPNAVVFQSRCARASIERGDFL
jgi:hypothetical protein